MTPRTFFLALQTALKAMVWGTTSNKVFGDAVYIVPSIPIEQLPRFQSTCAFIIDGGAVCDAESPQMLVQNFSIEIYVENVSSAFGEGVLLGANRVSDTSQGAGILDIEDELISKLADVDTLGGVVVNLIEKSTPRATAVRDNFPAVTRSTSFSVILSLV